LQGENGKMGNIYQDVRFGANRTRPTPFLIGFGRLS
jgi:hypothetical protein